MVKNQRKFGWIEACLRYGGAFGPLEKVVYREIFEVSEPSTSRHQVEFIAAVNAYCAEDVLESVKGKISFTDAGALPRRPIFRLPTMTEWLTDVMGNRFERVQAIARIAPDHHILQSCLQGIRNRQVMCATYVSKTGQSTSVRSLSIHSLVDIVGRYHVRCYDHSKNRFGDFILSHMLSCNRDGSGIPYVDASTDKEWAGMEKISITAKEGPSRAAAVIDFCLGDEGVRLVQLRAAFVGYVLDDIPDGYESPIIIRKVTTSSRNRAT